MNSTKPTQMRLYDRTSKRLYLNASERERFRASAERQPPHINAFCLTLLHTGCRLSEARELTIQSLQAKEQLLAIRSLKKRSQHHIREIPIPTNLVSILRDQIADKPKTEFPKGQNNPLLWQSDTGEQINRITAYRWIKTVMAEANIYGPHASPKGLRHGFGIHAVRCGIQLNMLQKWMGHANIKTTAIYANAIGLEELEIARKMW